MSATHPAAAPAAPSRGWSQAWGPALAVLLAVLVALGALFAEEGAAAIDTWDRSTAYNHCWLVLPIAAWLAWTRRDRLAGLAPAPTALFALPALGAAVAWLAAERLGIMEGRQLAALALVILAALSVLGWRIGKAMAAPLAYLVFLVPFGAFAVPALQKITAWVIVAGLKLLSIPHYADDLVIEIPAGTFLVAEACAGLRFTIASIAFGALYALVMFRSPGRRLVVLALSVAVPIVANGLRALGIVLLGHHLGSAEAAAADHVLYGWVFFTLVILLLVLLGLPFRQDTAPAAAGPAPRPMGAPRLAALLGAGALSLLLSGAAPALAGWIDRGAGSFESRPARLAAPEGCAPAGPGELRCGGLTFTGQVLAFSPHVTWGSVSVEANRLSGDDDEALTFSVSGEGGIWRGRQSTSAPRLAAVGAWLHGRPAGGGIRSRAEQGWSSLRGEGRPVLVVVSLRERAGAADLPRERERLRQILEAQGAGVARQAAGVSRGGTL